MFQVRVLLKEVEEARGGVVSSTSDLPELMAAGDALNSSSAGAVISEHLVTFKLVVVVVGVIVANTIVCLLFQKRKKEKIQL